MAIAIDPMTGFGSDRLEPIPIADAAHRVKVFCTSATSGWGVYDLAGHHARQAGAFDSVSSASFLWADALAGRVDVKDLAAFNDHTVQFAELVSHIDPTRDLGAMDHTELSAVTELCKYGFHRVWAPKITKVAALYRPRAVPVLDGHLAEAFGYKRAAFSEGEVGPRWERIDKVVLAIAAWLADNRDAMKEIRRQITVAVPDHRVASDVRLLDIVLWSTADDRIERPPNKRRDAWLEGEVRAPIRLTSFAPVPLARRDLYDGRTAHARTCD